MASPKVSTICLVFLLPFASFLLHINGRRILAGRNFLVPLSNEKEHYDTVMVMVGFNAHKVGAEYYGASAQISLWPISNVTNSTSGYSLTLGNINQGLVKTGFHVDPDLYNDSHLHFYVTWGVFGNTGPQSNDFLMKGPQSNVTKPPGFVVADGATLQSGQVVPPPLSSYNKEDHSITLTIKKDKQTKDWLLCSTSLGKTTKLGWWPATLFRFDYAQLVQFSGAVVYNGETGPPMGSGHKADEGEKKATYFKQITLYDEDGKGYVPDPKDMYGYGNDCYTVSDLLETLDHGRMFYYGGPGGCKMHL